MGLTSQHKHIKNTSTCITIPTENILETGRRTPIQPRLQERFPGNWVGWGKKSTGSRSVPLEGV